MKTLPNSDFTCINYLRLDAEARQTAQVAEGVLWRDTEWPFQNDLAGSRRKISIYWNREVWAKQYFTDRKWQPLLDEFKLLVWSCMTEYPSGNLKPTNLQTISQGVYSLGAFLFAHHITSLAYLNVAISHAYLDWLMTDYLSDDIDEEISYSSLTHRVQILHYIEVQRNLLTELGYSFPTHTLLDKPVAILVKERIDRDIELIPAIPEEIATTLVNEALVVLRNQASDVESALELHFKTKSTVLERTGDKHRAGVEAAKVLNGFTFSNYPNSEIPWHAPLTRIKKGVSVSQQIREVSDHIRDAGCILIQACTGIRVSEVCGLLTKQPQNGMALPTCIEIRQSKDKVYEVFYLQGKVYKKNHPEPCEWVIGMRPNGSNSLPIVVEAICIIEKTFRSVRNFGQVDFLIPSYASKHGLPTSRSSVIEFSGRSLNVGLKRFAAQHINWNSLPSHSQAGENLQPYIESSGAILRSHQWRKNFGQFLFRTDPKITPEISRHFKHANILITQQYYIGNDHRLLQDIRSMQVRETARFFYEYCTGETITAGMGGSLIDRNKDLFLPIQLSNKQVDIAHISKNCEESQLLVTFHVHGNCLIALSPLSSQCHAAAGTQSWANKLPNSTTQTPGMCLGCQCYAVDAKNLDFWQQRYHSNNNAWLIATSEGRGESFLIAKQRAEQAKKVISIISGEPYGQD